MMARPVVDLPEPNSPTMPKALAAEGEGHVAHGTEIAVVAGVDDAQIAHGQKRAIAHAGARIRDVAQAVAQQVEAEADDEDGHARDGRDPPLVEQHLPAGGDHRAPFGRRRLRAEAEEAQARRR